MGSILRRKKLPFKSCCTRANSFPEGRQKNGKAASHQIVPIYLKTFQSTVKILKIGTPEIITINVLQLEQLDFTVQYCVQKMQTE